jgi:hypothetical protein
MITALFCGYLWLVLTWILEAQTTDFNDYILGSVLLHVDLVRVPLEMIIEQGWTEGLGFSL